MWFFSRRESQKPEYSQFVHQLSEIDRLERDSQDLYRFCVEACKEIYKHSGSNDWFEKLSMLINRRGIN